MRLRGTRSQEPPSPMEKLRHKQPHWGLVSASRLSACARLWTQGSTGEEVPLPPRTPGLRATCGHRTPPLQALSWETRGCCRSAGETGQTRGARPASSQRPARRLSLTRTARRCCSREDHSSGGRSPQLLSTSLGHRSPEKSLSECQGRRCAQGQSRGRCPSPGETCFGG